MQNEGTQEAVCEDRVREVERLMMMRDSSKCERMQCLRSNGQSRLMLRSLRSSLPHWAIAGIPLIIFEASLEGGF